ncbi:MAG: hypothetical protein ACIRZL_05440 [Limosilactobacillus mucosae]
MPVNQITNGQEDWLKTLNDNFTLINKLPVDNAGFLKNVGTFMNGATADEVSTVVVQFNHFKVIYLYIRNLTVPTGTFGKPFLKIASTVKPNMPIAFIANQHSYVTTTDLNNLDNLYFWTTESTDQKYMNIGTMYIHLDN